MWTVIEPGIYLIASCLPSLRSLFNPLFKRFSLSTLIARFQSSLPGKSFLDSSIRGTHPSPVPHSMGTITPTHETESVRCFSRLEGPWQSDDFTNSEPRTSVSCYRTQSLIHEADDSHVAGTKSIISEADLNKSPFVIMVQKTTSLSSEPRIAKMMA